VFRPLEGLRILDLSVLIPGSACTHHFADYGADVVKVERPPVGDWLRSVPPIHDGLSLLHLAFDRNKRSIAIDLRTPEGQAVLHQMARSADAVVEVSGTRAMQALRADYETLRQINERIVYLSLTGFGQHSAYARLPTHGANLAAFAGVAAASADANGDLHHAPLPWGRYRLPLEEAALHGAFALLSAIRERDRTGTGRFLDVSLVQALMIGDGAAMTDAMNRTSRFWDDWHQPVAKNGYYTAADGKILGVCPIEERFWARFCALIGRDDLADAGDWSAGEVDLAGGSAALYREVQAALATRPRHEWLALFREHRIPSAPLNTIEDALADPELSGALVVQSPHPTTGESVKTFAPAVQDPPRSFVANPAPAVGQDAHDVLEEYGVEAHLIEAAQLVGALGASTVGA